MLTVTWCYLFKSDSSEILDIKKIKRARSSVFEQVDLVVASSPGLRFQDTSKQRFRSDSERLEVSGSRLAVSRLFLASCSLRGAVSRRIRRCRGGFLVVLDWSFWTHVMLGAFNVVARPLPQTLEVGFWIDVGAILSGSFMRCSYLKALVVWNRTPTTFELTFTHHTARLATHTACLRLQARFASSEAFLELWSPEEVA